MSMQTIDTFLFPLLLMAGAGILISSTSLRYNRMHEEFHHIIQNPKEAEPTFVAHMLRRAVFLKKALEALYWTIALYIISAFLGNFQGLVHWVFIATMTCATACLFYAIVRLIQESRLSIKVIRLHKSILEREMHWD